MCIKHLNRNRIARILLITKRPVTLRFVCTHKGGNKYCDSSAAQMKRRQRARSQTYSDVFTSEWFSRLVLVRPPQSPAHSISHNDRHHHLGVARLEVGANTVEATAFASPPRRLDFIARLVLCKQSMMSREAERDRSLVEKCTVIRFSNCSSISVACSQSL